MVDDPGLGVGDVLGQVELLGEEVGPAQRG